MTEGAAMNGERAERLEHRGIEYTRRVVPWSNRGCWGAADNEEWVPVNTLGKDYIEIDLIDFVDAYAALQQRVASLERGLKDIDRDVGVALEEAERSGCAWELATEKILRRWLLGMQALTNRALKGAYPYNRHAREHLEG